MSLFDELKRRNVWRVALFYVLGSWLTLQIADVLVPALALPMWVLRLIALLLILGFPVALVIAWVYELTPDGLKREGDVQRDESITHETGRKLNVVITVLLVVAIVGIAVDRLIPESPSSGAERVSAETDSDINNGDDSTLFATMMPTIAVLPFVSRDVDDRGRMTAVALADQLRILLTSSERLRVTGSISSDIAAENGLDIGELRRQLNVEHVLRGSVSEQDGMLNVQVELIETGDGFNKWSKAYTRPSGQVSGVLNEIADQVLVTVVGQPGGGPEYVRATETEIAPEAYQAYLLGTFFLDRNDSVADYARAMTEFERVTEMEADYAIGWARLARARLGVASRQPGDEILQASRIAAERAIALAPELHEAWAVLGALKLTAGTDFAGAQIAMRRALQLNPNAEYATRLAALLEVAAGRPAEASRLSVHATSIDPLSSKALRNACLFSLYGGELDRAIELGNRALELSPDAVVVRYGIARAYAAKGDMARALAVIEDEPVIPFRDFGRVYIMVIDGQDARVQVDALIEEYADVAAINIAELYGYSGNPDKAFEWLNRAIDSKDTGLFEVPSYPGLRPFHEDPRWQEFLERAGLADLT